MAGAFPAIPPGETFMSRILAVMVAMIGLMMVSEPRATAAQKVQEVPGKNKPDPADLIFLPTPEDVVEEMLTMAKVKKGDVVYDLGCGNGRIVVAAAKRGAKASGWDINPVRIKEAKENVKQNKVESNAKIVLGDIFALDLSGADVITLYLFPRLTAKLIPQLEKLKPGARIVSHDFGIAGIKPDKVVQVISEDDDQIHTVYLWTTPLKRENKANK
jgi:tRNA G37 N-methylase Trm5